MGPDSPFPQTLSMELALLSPSYQRGNGGPKESFVKHGAGIRIWGLLDSEAAPLPYSTSCLSFSDHLSLKYELDSVGLSGGGGQCAGAGRGGADVDGGQGNSEGWGLGGMKTQTLKLYKGTCR